MSDEENARPRRCSSVAGGLRILSPRGVAV